MVIISVLKEGCAGVSMVMSVCWCKSIKELMALETCSCFIVFPVHNTKLLLMLVYFVYQHSLFNPAIKT